MPFLHPPTLSNERRRALAASLAGAALLGACAVPPPHHRMPEREVVVIQQPAPPPLRVEYPPQPPAFDAYWVHGHWAWDGREYVWNGGHWTRPHQGEVLVRAQWDFEGGRWVFRPEHWERLAPPQGVPEVVVRIPPPMPRVEAMPAPPSPDQFWIAGHWRWTGASFEWQAGRWERHRPGHFYVHPHWIQINGSFHFVGGYWQ